MDIVPITVATIGSSLLVATEIVVIPWGEDWCRVESAKACMLWVDSVVVIVRRRQRSAETSIFSLRSPPPQSPFVFFNFSHCRSPHPGLLTSGLENFVPYQLLADDIRVCDSSLWAGRELLNPKESDCFNSNLSVAFTLREMIGTGPEFERVPHLEADFRSNGKGTIFVDAGAWSEGRSDIAVITDEEVAICHYRRRRK